MTGKERKPHGPFKWHRRKRDCKSLDTLNKDIAGLNRMIGELAEEKSARAKDQTRRVADDVRNAASDIAMDTQMRAVDAGKHVRNEALAACDSAEDVVRRQPALSVGVAAGLGFLVGLMATHRG